MMKFFPLILIFISFLTSCKQEVKNEETTVNDSHPEITIAGSETELGLVKVLYTQFEKSVKESNFEIEGGGSVKGLNDLIEGKITMANSSVPISMVQRNKIKDKNLELVEIIFALDAVAIITNDELGVDSLSNFQLRNIYEGKITNWSEVGGPNMGITLYGRNDNSGTNDFFWKKIIQSEGSEEITIVEDNDEMLLSIEDDISGIGYLGVGNVMDNKGKPNDKIWAVNIYVEGGSTISPYEVSRIKSGDFFLNRPLYQYFFKKDWDKLKTFVEFELSKDGQNIIESFGFFPITDNYKLRNETQLIKAGLE